MYPVTFSPIQTQFFQPGMVNGFSAPGYPVQSVPYNPPQVVNMVTDNFRTRKYRDKINKIVSGQTNIYEKYKDNKEFRKLAGTEFYNGQQGLQNLVNTVANLEIEKNQAAVMNAHGGLGTTLDWVYRDKASADIPECLGNTYKVLSDNRFSPELKKHVVNKASDLTFQVMQLGNIDEMLATEPNIRQIEQGIMMPYMFM